MADYGKLNLAALPSHKVVEFKAKDGTPLECLVLPIKKNHLFKSEKGNIYLDLVAFRNKEPKLNKDGGVEQTHLVKQSLSKEVRDAMTDEQKKQQPIIGNLNIFDGAFVEKQAKPDAEIGDASGDDLPF